MNKKQIENTVHSMVSTIVLSLTDIFIDEHCIEIINKFSKSKTFADLFNFDTELWKESPDYIIECYLEELGENELLREFGEKDTD